MSRATTQQRQTNIEELRQKILEDHERSSKLNHSIVLDELAVKRLEEEIQGLEAKIQGLQAKIQNDSQEFENIKQRRADNERAKSILEGQLHTPSIRQHRQPAYTNGHPQHVNNVKKAEELVHQLKITARLSAVA